MRNARHQDIQVANDFWDSVEEHLGRRSRMAYYEPGYRMEGGYEKDRATKMREANEQMDELKENDSYDWEVNLDTQGSVSFSATFKEDKIPDVTAAYRAAISAFAK